MNKPAESFLPNYLKQSLCACVKVDSSVIDSAPDIVILNSNGNMYEVKAQKIVNSLNLHKVNGRKIFCAYLVENQELAIFYLVHTNEYRLLCIKRWDSRLEVIDTYEDVRFFEVYDFMCLGYPQIRIKSGESSAIKFFINDTKAPGKELECETDFNPIAKSLAEKLQIICRHVDELSEEWHSVRKLCQFNIDRQDFNLFPIESVKFLLPLEKGAGKLTITASWVKVIGLKLALGIKFLNDGKEALSDLVFIINGKSIKDYSYRFFFLCDDSVINNYKNTLFSCDKISSVQPGQEITVVGAVPIDFLNLSFRKIYQISCYLASGKLKNYLIGKTFEINISDLIDFSNKFFQSLKNTCSVEDLQIIKTVKLETKLKIETKNYEINSLLALLKETLGFVEVKTLTNWKLYYCISTYLSEVFVVVQSLTVFESVWKIILYTGDESQVYFLVNVLYHFLPENSVILLDED